MLNDIRYPYIPRGASDHERIEAIRSYLFYICDVMRHSGESVNAPKDEGKRIKVASGTRMAKGSSVATPTRVISGAALAFLRDEGVYYSESLPSDAPRGATAPVFIEVTSAMGHVYQRIKEVSVYGTEYMRMDSGEWECVNPPMRVGEEYRTTERYMGKAVYTALVELGQLPSRSIKGVEHGIECTAVIRVHGQISDGGVIPYYASEESWAEISADKTRVVVMTGTDLSGHTGRACLYYTKQ